MKLTWRMWLLIILLLLSILAIKPSFDSGVVVKSIEKDSSSFSAGLRAGEIIKSINGHNVKDMKSYGEAISNFAVNGTEQKIDIKTKKNEYIFLTNETLKITVEDIPPTKIQMGLDLRGGARALVQPDIPVSDEQMQDLITISRNRFNVYGLSDIQIRAVSDLSGNKFMLVEVAGASPADLKELVSKQGKFEARIGNGSDSLAENITLNLVSNESEEFNETNSSTNITSNENQTIQLNASGGILVFEGGKGDIADVCRNRAECSGITGCFEAQGGGYACNFRFTIYLTETAAKKHAAITKNISLDSSGKYLIDKLYLYIDGNEVDSLLIGADLRGQVTTQVSIQGAGTGKAQQDALNDAKANMNKLQTVLITGSLPYKLNIVKMDTISPNLGSQFSYLLLLAGAAAMLAVGLIIFLRYRRWKASLALIFTSFSEILIILGIAALIRWNLDLPSIAGILATIGTGVDQQIVILDEARSNLTISVLERMKRALFVIVSSYFTALVSLLPLYWAVAGLFKGFAITTLIGITVGVLVTRPAFSDMIKKIEE
jgi:preprotein translocase subunit SecD